MKKSQSRNTPSLANGKPPLQPFVAAIGAGYWGRNLVRVFHEIGALRAICDANPDLVQEAAARYSTVKVVSSFTAILEDPLVRAVAIATPAVNHHKMAMEALSAGKDVFVEKPLALSVKDGAELIDFAAKRGRVLMVGHILAYHPAIVKLCELVQSGELGKIQYIYSNRLNIGKIRHEENILWSFAPHDVSVVLMLLQEMPVEVRASGRAYLQQNIPDVTMTQLTFASGVEGHLFVSWLHPVKEQKLVVVGDKKMAVFDDVSATEKLVLFPHKIAWVNRMPVAQKAERHVVPLKNAEPLRVECLHFLECVANRSTPRTDGSEGLRVLRVLEATEQSLKNRGTTVSLLNTAPPPRATTSANVFVHETSCIDENVEIGSGTKIWHFSHVLKGTRIGRNCSFGQNVVVGPNVTVGNKCKVQNNVSIYQGVTLEDEVFCGPSMVFTNVNNPRSAIVRIHELKKTLVKRGASIGANATIVCGHTIGAYSFIGAGAVVTKDVPDFALVVGNPSRIVGWMCKCGIRLNFNNLKANCAECGSGYVKNKKNTIVLNESLQTD